jgi:hypothetical protein
MNNKVLPSERIPMMHMPGFQLGIYGIYSLTNLDGIIIRAQMDRSVMSPYFDTWEIIGIDNIVYPISIGYVRNYDLGKGFNLNAGAEVGAFIHEEKAYRFSDALISRDIPTKHFVLQTSRVDPAFTMSLRLEKFFTNKIGLVAYSNLQTAFARNYELINELSASNSTSKSRLMLTSIGLGVVTKW